MGHIISKEGIKPDPAKIDKVQQYPVPKNLTQIRAFLGLASYYRRFIKDFSSIAKPLNYLLRKDIPYIWTQEQQNAFEKLKNYLITAPILAYPKFNESFILYTDASTYALGAILAQNDENNKEHIIAYASRTLSPAEKNYSITELECLAIVWAIKHFHHYIYGATFTLITDHSALCYLFNLPNPTGRIARWIIKLQGYTFNIKHRSGNKHTNVDTFSRLPPLEN